MIRIHRLVAGAFIENPNNLPQVNHKNGNKEDNKIDNLEWVSSKENIRHGFDNGLITRAKGNKHYKSKKVQQYDLQGNLIKEWDSINEAQKQLNIGNISKCCRKDKNYTTIGGYVWKYAEENEVEDK